MLIAQRKKKSERSRLIKKLDAIFSKKVRARDNYTCQRCGRKYEEKQSGLHCSHFWKRGLMGTRWNLDNCIALCYGCHRNWEGFKQGDYKDFMVRRLGQQSYELLEVKARTITKFTVSDLRFLLKQGEI